MPKTQGMVFALPIGKGQSALLVALGKIITYSAMSEYLLLMPYHN